MHRYEKLWLGAALLLIVGIIATISYGAVGLGIEMVGDDEKITPEEIPDDERFSVPPEPGNHIVPQGDGHYDVYMVANQYSFHPGTPGPRDDQYAIQVPEGSTVTFYVTSDDVIHGMELVGTNVNTMVIPGEIAVMTAEFDEPAEYGILCNEYCGDGHHNMEGKMEVVPEEEWDGVEGVTDDE